MRKIGYLLAAVLATCFFGAAKVRHPSIGPETSAPPQEYDFRGAKLGTSLSDFRMMAYPDTTDAELVHLICTGDVGADAVGLTLSTMEKQEGITKCNYFKKSTVLPMMLAAGVAVGNSGYVAYDLSYAFVPDPKDGVPRLFLVALLTNANAFDHAYTGLVQKFGPPTSKKVDTTQNMMGANFPHTVASWNNSASRIYLECPSQKIDKMLLSYYENRLFSVVAAKENRITGTDASKM